MGAVLTQNTAWINVEKAMDALRAAAALDPRVLHAMDHDSLAGLIRPAGYFNVKARRLHAVVAFLMETADGDVTALSVARTEDLRGRLLDVYGVGRETADSILLYALDKPVFVVDAYTRRLFGRLGFLDPTTGYDVIRARFEAALGRDVALYNDYHAQIVIHGKESCRPKPLCAPCVLSDLCASRLDGPGDRGVHG